jgi:hypothetical protein
MRPFLFDPGCENLLTSDAFRRRYLGQVEPWSKWIRGAIVLTLPFWPALIAAVVGLCTPWREVLYAAPVAALMGWFPFAIILFFVVREGRHYLRLRRLAYHGRLVEGRLIALKERTIPNSGDDNTPDTDVWTVDYEVRSPSGELLRRTAMRRTKPPGPVPPPGTPVVVLMLDEETCDIL